MDTKTATAYVEVDKIVLCINLNIECCVYDDSCA